jgi:hypothetical protein
MKKWLLVGGMSLYAAMAAAQVERQRGEESVPPARPVLGGGRGTSVGVPLDATGVSAWRYLNPRRPANVFKSLEQEIDVRCPPATNAERNREAKMRLRQIAPEPHECLPENALPLTVLFLNKTAEQTFSIKFSVSVGGPIRRLQEVASQALHQLRRAVAVEAAASLPGTVEERLALLDALVEAEFHREWLAREQKRVDDKQPGAPSPEALRELKLSAIRSASAVARLDGGARHDACLQKMDAAFDPRNTPPDALAAALACAGGTVDKVGPGGALVDQIRAVADLQIVEKQALFNASIASAAGGPQAPANGIPCETKGGPAPVCEFSITVQPGRAAEVDAGRLARIAGATAPDTPLRAIEFTVSAYREREKLAYDRGYIALSSVVLEPDSSASPALQASLIANTGMVDGQLTPETPYTSSRRVRRLPETSRVSVTQKLGNRAILSGDLNLKNNELGLAEDGVVTPSQYLVRVFGMQGTTLTFGRFLVAAPGRTISTRVFGDAVAASWRAFELSGTRSNRDLATPPPKTPSDAPSLAHALRRKTFAFRARNLTVGSVGQLRGVNLLALAGRTRTPVRAAPEGAVDNRACFTKTEGCDDAYEFYTLGGDLTFGVSRSTLGTFEAYHNWRTGREPFAGHGTAALLTLTTAQARDGKTPGTFEFPRSLTFTGGFGTADDAGAPRRRGYMGETPSFAPDQVFLATLAARIPGVGGSLGNKWYGGVSVSDKTTSLLASLTEAVLRMPSSDIVARSTTVSAHHYRLRTDTANETSLGTELGIQFQMEAPRGVKWEVAGAHFFHGAALEGLFPDEAWTLSAAISVNVN